MNREHLFHRLCRAARGLRSFGRPLALLAAVCLCVGMIAPAAAEESSAFYGTGVLYWYVEESGNSSLGQSAPASPDIQRSTSPTYGTLQINFFHDLNANQIPEPDELIAPLPDGSLQMGDGQVIDVTYRAAPVSRNLGMSSLATGYWTIASVNPPSGYRITDSLGIQPTLSSAYDLYDYADLPGFYLDENEIASLYIPLLADPASASMTGNVRYNENSAAAVGATVELLDQSGQTLANAPPLQIIDETGAYTFDGLEPGTYRLRATAPANDTSVQYSPLSSLSSVLTVLDGTAHTMDFGFSRTAQVYFYLDSQLVSTYSDVGYGTLIASPAVNSAYLTLTNGTKRIDGWYRDTAFTQPWIFASDAVTENISLYAKWTYLANSTSSYSDYSWGTPKIQSARAYLSEDNRSVQLSVRMAGETYTDDDGDKEDVEFDYTYLWQKRDQSDYWDDLYEGDRSKYTYSTVNPGTTHQFRVIVTREDDGKTVTSNTLIVNVPSSTDASAGSNTDSAQMAPLPASGLPDMSGGTSPMGGMMSALPDLGDMPDGDVTLEFIVSDNPVYKGGRVELTPTQAGGDWGWDDTLLSMESPGVFTALDIGSANIVYNYMGTSIVQTIEILPARLPATGQSVTPILLAGSAGLCAWLAAMWLWLRRRKGEQHAS